MTHEYQKWLTVYQHVYLKLYKMNMYLTPLNVLCISGVQPVLLDIEDPKQDESPLMKRFAAAIAPSDPENDWMRAETNPYDDTSLVNIARRSRLWNMRGNGIVPYYKHRAAVNYGAKLRPRFGMRYGWTRPRGMNREYRPYRPYIKRYPPPIFGGIDWELRVSEWNSFHFL